MSRDYSQFGEQAQIFAALKEIEDRKIPFSRRVLDIGAHDGVTYSNSRALIESGWGATLVEPSPTPFLKLMDLYRGNDAVKLVHAAVAASPGYKRVQEMHDSRGSYYTTFEESQRREFANSCDWQKIHVALITLDDLFETCPGPYGMISLDVEGWNPQIFNWLAPLLDKLVTQVACIEHQGKIDLIEKCAPQFKRYYANHCNLILQRVHER